ncbi:TIGR02221 family CRISPR-associated protein [Methanotorris igneus]|uniref:CRISPR-associated protein DxTHG motif protein n=1 Tax=Methanotorris igneus (strain DSM 5666 / JCM 11834 / Kol 5) TaxID=880724 RepID=F6BEB2_METIK|nr:TIGR02221 family CRISPR-associated protein [Methanotorris igneus]AEF96789.1 CRISPR-associated protein DxTHG motif protein [Methanotorris igneus Kol 5]
MPKKLISFLGAGKYEPCIYKYENKSSTESRFIQKALIELICKDWEEKDEIIILLTEKSEKMNWEGETYKGLKYELEEMDIKPEIKTIKIPDGNTEEEVWEIFNKIFEIINERDEIYIDITHSFRYLPMLATIILDYAKTLKGIKVKKIFYGNVFGEPRIMELQELDRLLDWNKAIDKFLTTGYVEDLYNLSKREYGKLHKENRELHELLKNNTGKLKKYMEYLATVRGDEINNFDYDEFKNEIDEIIKIIKKDSSLAPLIPLIEKIKDKFKDFKNNDKYNCLRAVSLCIEFNLIQQAYTLLQESVITLICKDLDLDYLDKEYRGLVSSALNIVARDLPKNEWKIPGKDEDEKKKNLELLKKIVDHLKTNNLTKLSKLYDKLTQYRNNINHAGFNKDKMEPKKFKNMINEIYRNILNFYSI